MSKRYISIEELQIMKKPELKKLAKEYKIPGRSYKDKSQLYLDLSRIITISTENKIRRLLRARREVRPKTGIIEQKTIKPIPPQTLVFEVLEDPDFVHVNDNIMTYVRLAVEELYKDSNVVIANLNYYFMWYQSENAVAKGEYQMSKREVNKALAIPRNYKQLEAAMITEWLSDTSPKKNKKQPNFFDPKVGGPDSESQTFILGYLITYATKQGTTINKKTIYDLKAFSPCNNRDFHKLCTASTSNYKICIYETFLDIMDLHKLKHSRRNTDNNKKLTARLDSEGDEISKVVKNGELVKSLELLTKKYDTEMYIFFYGTLLTKRVDISELSDRPIKIIKGVASVMSDEEVGLTVGKKCFLYEKHYHVAPFLFKYNSFNKVNRIDKVIADKFVLRPITLKGKVEKVQNILGFDLETYTDENHNCIAYCVCLVGILNGKEIKESFYGDKCIAEFIAYIQEISTRINSSKAKTRDAIPPIYIYGFNNGKYDNIFIYDALYKLDPNSKFIFTGNAIKWMQYNNISFYDISLFYACGSLRKTGKAFKLEKEKGVFPYLFTNKDNLYYIGETPAVEFWNDKDKETEEEETVSEYVEYLKKEGNNFDMKQYTIKYCLLDCELVYEIAKYHIDSSIGVIKDKHYNVAKCPTSANQAKAMYQQVFQEEELYQSPDHIIKHEGSGNDGSYKGGRTEIFQKQFLQELNRFGLTLKAYDINSAHPHSMTELMPFKYTKSVKYGETEITEDEITDYFNYYAKSEYTGNKKVIPNLLIRKKSGLAASTKTNYAWHWGAELKEAIRNGFKINVKEVDMYEGKACFKSFAEYFYNERLKIKSTNEALSLFYKNVMNSFYGKTGQRCFLHSELFSSMNEFYNKYSADTNKFCGLVEVGDKLLISFSKIDDEYHNVGKLVRFASYIAALTRCKLSKAMRILGHENIYYCDTDSIYTTGELPADMVSKTEFGKWKLENEILSANFIAPKCYQYININGELNKKSKGVSAKKMMKQDYIDLINGTVANVPKQMKMFIRSLSGVKIIDTQRTIQCVYNKRNWEGNESSPFENEI